MSTEAQATAETVHRRARRVGRVTSVSGIKSVVVQVDRQVMDDRYGKFVRRRTKFMAHDEACQCAPGDVVEIVSTRPLSARKRWRVAKIVRRHVAADPIPTGGDEEAGQS